MGYLHFLKNKTRSRLLASCLITAGLNLAVRIPCFSFSPFILGLFKASQVFCLGALPGWVVQVGVWGIGFFPPKFNTAAESL